MSVKALLNKNKRPFPTPPKNCSVIGCYLTYCFDLIMSWFVKEES